MKELIKIICFVLITLAILTSAGFYCWETYKKQMFYTNKQKCIERCYSLINQDKEFQEMGSPAIELMKRCSEHCNYFYLLRSWEK